MNAHFVALSFIEITSYSNITKSIILIAKLPLSLTTIKPYLTITFLMSAQKSIYLTMVHL